MKRLALIAEYDPAFEPHAATQHAVEHSVRASGADLTARWVSSEEIDDRFFDEYDALWLGPGSPYRNLAKTLRAIRYAREHRIPLFGTCGGFQHVALEIARNILKFEDARHAEYDPYASRLFISELACSPAGREMIINLVEGSRAARLYGKLKVKEKYYCNFGVNPEYADLLKVAPVSVTGADSEGEIRIIELPDHPFFVATLFVPQVKSTREDPHPLVTGFIRAITTHAHECRVTD